MVSRRKILSRSRDDLNTEQQYVPEDEEDVWYQKDKLFKVSINAGKFTHAGLFASSSILIQLVDEGVN